MSPFFVLTLYFFTKVDLTLRIQNLKENQIMINDYINYFRNMQIKFASTSNIN